MELSEITQAAPAVPGEAATAVTASLVLPAPQPTPGYQQCDDCAAPVDIDQRYCVSCGAHRRNVNDPAARYLSHATARARTARTAGAARRSPHAGGGRIRGLGLALLLALIPAVAALGVLVGRSSNNDDARLIQALTRNEAARAAAPAATATVSSSGSPASSTQTTGARGAKQHKRSSAKAASGRSRQAASSTTQFGSVSQIAGSTPSQAQRQQGAQDTQKVQKSTGKTYVNGQSSLPGSVVVP